MDKQQHQQPFGMSIRVMLVSRHTGEELARIPNIVQTGEINRNQDTQVTETASLTMVGETNLGADLVRIYADLTYADGQQESVMLGTYLADGPKREVNGAQDSTTDISCYGRLRELADDEFAYPVSLDTGANPMTFIETTIREAGLDVAPHDTCTYKLGQTWTFGMEHGHGESKLDAINELLTLMNWNSARTDPQGRILLTPYQDPAKRAPSWEFTEGEGARFLQTMTDEKDWYDTANQVRVIYSNEDRDIIGIAIDDNPDSEFSIPTRGRIISKTYSYSDVPDNMSDSALQKMADTKAKELLDTNQSVIHRITLTHIYAPITLGDVISLNYPSGNITGNYAIRTQTIKLEPGLPTETEARAFTRATQKETT